MKILSGALLGLVMLAAGLSPVVKAAEQVPNPGDVIEGMGARVPPGKTNVSRSPLFKAYVFKKKRASSSFKSTQCKTKSSRSSL